MLVKSNCKPGSIVTIKLSTAEEVVAKLVSDNGETVGVARPLVFTMNPQDGNAMLIPWLMSVEHRSPDTVTINKSNVITMNETTKQISDHYNQVTSPIKMPTASETSAISNLKV